MNLRNDYNNRFKDDVVEFILYIIVYGIVVYAGVKIIVKIIKYVTNEMD